MGAAEPNLLKYGEDPKLLKICSAILGSNKMEQLICQGHYKLAGDQVKFDWHQDCQHRGYGTPDWVDINGRGSYVQTLMAIDEVTADNGPVLFVPRSVKDKSLNLDRHEDPTFLFDVKSAVPMLMQPGDIAFFSPYVVHGSKPNTSGGSRRVFINGFAYPGANRRQYPGEGSGREVFYR
jgi:ectoine hydroxylase-related dioxygenase (phytanoyl-CoA dioxygenase family)